MLKIVLLLGAFDIILCEIQRQTRPDAISQVPSCRNPPLCYLSDTYKTESKSISFLPYANSQNYGRQQSNLARSYHSGFGLSASPAYYPTFDPISVVASLAFLAFLLQSFASLFDRSRSILPTIVSGRQSTMADVILPEFSTHVSRALREYENLNEDLERK
ncbi:uncharacterized protein [Linepithema humile]|uniref:uncharacterized protein n=1 Tax=Linepithema humile TaxID=83485 RepID=UPI00351EE809